MGLLGNGWDDPQSAAIMSLAGGLLQGNFGGGLLGANQAYQEAKTAPLKEAMMKAQLLDVQQQIELRKQQAAQLERRNSLIGSLLGGIDSSVPQANDATIARTGNLAPTIGNAQVQQQEIGRLNAGNPLQGIPREAINFDLATNDGKNIAEWIFKKSQPNWVTQNGYTFNTNDPGFNGGFQPGMQMDSNGRSVVMTPDGKGGVGVSIPPGALDAVRQYAEVQKGAENRGTPLPETYRTPDGRPYGGSTFDYLEAFKQPQAAPVGQPTSSGSVINRGAPITQELAAFIARDSAAQGFTTPPTVNMTAPGYRNPTLGLAQGMPSGGRPVLQSVAEAEAQKAAALVGPKADTVYAEQTAKDVVEQRKSIMSAADAAPNNIAKYQQIGRLLADVDGGRLTPTGYDVASYLNSIGVKVNKNLPNVEAARAMANEAALSLRNPSGGAGMPGALSDGDRKFLSGMTPNEAQSAQGRTKIIDTYIALQKRNQQVAEFARKYENKYGRLDNGFFSQLQGWANSNPLFGSK